MRLRLPNISDLDTAAAEPQRPANVLLELADREKFGEDVKRSSQKASLKTIQVLGEELHLGLTGRLTMTFGTPSRVLKKEKVLAAQPARPHPVDELDFSTTSLDHLAANTQLQNRTGTTTSPKYEAELAAVTDLSARLALHATRHPRLEQVREKTEMLAGSMPHKPHPTTRRHSLNKHADTSEAHVAATTPKKDSKILFSTKDSNEPSEAVIAFEATRPFTAKIR